MILSYIDGNQDLKLCKFWPSTIVACQTGGGKKFYTKAAICPCNNVEAMRGGGTDRERH